MKPDEKFDNKIDILVLDKKYRENHLSNKSNLDNYKNQEIEIIDLNTLVPWDKELVFSSVKKTGKVLLLGEDTLFNSYLGEISAVISEEIFEYLDAPIVRVGSLDTPVPFAKNLEEGFQASYKLKDKLDYLLNY